MSEEKDLAQEVQRLMDDIWNVMLKSTTFNQNLHAIYTRLGDDIMPLARRNRIHMGGNLDA